MALHVVSCLLCPGHSPYKTSRKHSGALAGDALVTKRILPKPLCEKCPRRTEGDEALRPEA